MQTQLLDNNGNPYTANNPLSVTTQSVVSILIPDGNNVTQGAIKDSAVFTDSQGTINAHLRGLVKLLAAVINLVTGVLNVNVSSGKVTTTPITSATISAVGQFTIGAVTPVLLLSANSLRTRFTIKQDGTTVIFVAYGSNTPSSSNYTDSLAAGGVAHDGSINKIDDYQWQGSVYALSSASGGSVLVTEFQQ